MFCIKKNSLILSQNKVQIKDKLGHHVVNHNHQIKEWKT